MPEQTSSVNPTTQGHAQTIQREPEKYAASQYKVYDVDPAKFQEETGSGFADIIGKGLTRTGMRMGEIFGHSAGAVSKAAGGEGTWGEDIALLANTHVNLPRWQTDTEYREPIHEVWKKEGLVKSLAYGLHPKRLAGQFAEQGPTIAATAVAGALGGPGAAAWTMGALGGSLEGIGTYNEVIAGGGTEEEAITGGLAMGAVAGMLNKLGASSWMSPKASSFITRNVAGRIAKGAGVEAATEWFEEPSNVLILKSLGVEADFIESMKQGIDVLPMSMLFGAFGGAGVEVTTHKGEVKPKVQGSRSAEVQAAYEAKEITAEEALKQLAEEGRSALFTDDEQQRVADSLGVDLTPEEQALQIGVIEEMLYNTTKPIEGEELHTTARARLEESFALTDTNWEEFKHSYGDRGVPLGAMKQESEGVQAFRATKRKTKKPYGKDVQGVTEGVDIGKGGKVKITGREKMALPYLIRGVNGPDFTTGLHEMVHYCTLTAEEGSAFRTTADGIYKKASLADWTTKEHEEFVEGFMDYLLSGKAKSKKLNTTYGWLRDKVKSLVKVVQDLDYISDPDVMATYQMLLYGQDVETSLALQAWQDKVEGGLLSLPSPEQVVGERTRNFPSDAPIELGVSPLITQLPETPLEPLQALQELPGDAEARVEKQIRSDRAKEGWLKRHAAKREAQKAAIVEKLAKEKAAREAGGQRKHLWRTRDTSGLEAAQELASVPSPHIAGLQEERALETAMRLGETPEITAATLLNEAARDTSGLELAMELEQIPTISEVLSDLKQTRRHPHEASENIPERFQGYYKEIEESTIARLMGNVIPMKNALGRYEAGLKLSQEDTTLIASGAYIATSQELGLVLQGLPGYKKGTLESIRAIGDKLIHANRTLASEEGTALGARNTFNPKNLEIITKNADQLMQQGISLEEALEIYLTGDPEAKAELLAKATRKKKSLTRMLGYALFFNNMLAGKTIPTNGVMNAIHHAYVGGHRVHTSGWNKILAKIGTQDIHAMSALEGFKHLGALGRGLAGRNKEANKAFMDLLLHRNSEHEMTKWDEELGLGTRDLVKQVEEELKFRKGDDSYELSKLSRLLLRTISLPTTLLSACDLWAKAIIKTGENAAMKTSYSRMDSDQKLAYQQKLIAEEFSDLRIPKSKLETMLKDKGFVTPSGKAINVAKYSLQELLSPEFSSTAFDIAWESRMDRISEDITFQTPPGKVAEGMQNIRNAVPLGQAVFPFIRTPTNIFKRGAEFLPGVGLAFSKQMKRSKSEMVAKQVESVIMVSAIWAMLENGDLTGPAPEAPAERDAFYRQGKAPLCLRAGDKWISYANIEPFGMPMAVLTSMIQELRDMALQAGDPAKKNREYMEKFIRIAGACRDQFIDSSYARGAMEYLGGDKQAKRAFAHTTSSALVPYSAFWRTMHKAWEAGTTKEVVYNPQDSYLAMFGESLPVNIFEEDRVKLTLFADKSSRDSSFFREWLPIRWRGAQDDPVEQELARIEAYPGAPGDKAVLRNGETVEIPRDLYADFVMSYGPEAKASLKKLFASPGYTAMSQGRKKEVAERRVRKIRSRARKRMVRKVEARFRTGSV